MNAIIDNLKEKKQPTVLIPKIVLVTNKCLVNIETLMPKKNKLC